MLLTHFKTPSGYILNCLMFVQENFKQNFVLYCIEVRPRSVLFKFVYLQPILPLTRISVLNIIIIGRVLKIIVFCFEDFFISRKTNRAQLGKYSLLLLQKI